MLNLPSKPSLSVQFNGVKCFYIVVQQISRTFSSCKACRNTVSNRHQFTVNSPTAFYLCFCDFDHSRCSLQWSQSSSFCGWRIWLSTVSLRVEHVQQVAGSVFVLQPPDVPLCVWATCWRQFICGATAGSGWCDDTVVSLSVPLSPHDRLEFFGMHTFKWVAESDGAGSGLGGPSLVFSAVAVPVHLPAAGVQGSVFSASSPTLGIFFFLQWSSR